MAAVQYKNFAYLKGPKGDRGVKGDNGDRGPKGDQGPIGLTGPIGNINYSEIRSLFSGASPITYNNNTGVIGFNTTGFATETYVNNIFNNLVGNAPQALNTLNELASALNNDANFASSVITTLNGKLALAGGVMTGALTLNADPTENLQAATKQYVDSAVSSFATSLSELSDVAMTGNVVAGQVLKFNGTTWTNDTDNSGIGSVSWNSITGKPVFATVSTTGNYNDLTNKPTIPSFNQSLNTTNSVTFNSVTATSIDVENLEFTGTGPIVISSGNDLKFTSAGDITFNGSKLSTVAISGSYNDLTNKPTLFSGSYTDLTNKPTIPADISQLTDTLNLLSSYVLPTASTGTLGGVKVDGTTILIDSFGVISSVGGSGGSGSGASNWSDISVDGGIDFESMGSDPDNYGSSELVIDGGEFVFSGSYTPGDATSWTSPAPTTIDQALDRLAAKIAYLSDQGYTQKP